MSTLSASVDRSGRPLVPNFQTMAEALRWRAQIEPDRLAYNFLTDGEDLEARFTYSELDARARAVARFL
jgi:acyl-CoA synthetase (AMP-forming)/AMP-acid ligase II